MNKSLTFIIIAILSCVFVFLCSATYQNSSHILLKPVEEFNNSGRSEGLDSHRGFLWQTEGDAKIIRKIDPTTGNVVRSYSSATLYPESLTWMSEESFVHIGFKRHEVLKGHFDSEGVLRWETIGKLEEIGFGIVKRNSNSFFVSGYYSSNIYLYSYPSLNIISKIKTKLKAVEDLAWDGKYLWATDYEDTETKKVYQIDPKSGDTLVTIEIDSKTSCKRLDGVAIHNQYLYVAGKDCALFVLEISKD